MVQIFIPIRKSRGRKVALMMEGSLLLLLHRCTGALQVTVTCAEALCSHPSPGSPYIGTAHM